MLLSVKQQFFPDERLLSLMETFRYMLNNCVRIGLSQNKTSLMSLRYACYPELKKYQIASAYKNNAISRANGILSNYRRLLRKGKKPRIPHCWKPMITTCKGFVLRLEGDHLVLPSKIMIPLNHHALKKLQRSVLRSVTINTQTVSIAYAIDAKETIEPLGVLGVDLNYQNITCADTLDNLIRLPMKDVAIYKLKCRETKRHFKRSDC